MANITVSPQGNIYLCKTKLENDYKNQLTFTNASAQSTYFASTIQKTYSNYTYVKKDNYIQVSDNIDTIIECNYLYYVNTGFTTKKYYCFITRMEYINENCTRIYFETDVFQTWQFQIQYTQSFVEREHVNDDTIGLHTVPEMVEKGEYLPASDSFFIYNNGLSGMDWVACIGVSENVFTQNQIKIYNNTYSGLQYFALKDSNSIAAFLNYYAKEGKVEEIYTLFIIPIAFISDSVITFEWDEYQFSYKGETWTVHYKEVPSSYNAFNLGTMSLSRPSQLGVGNNKYTPRNNKLLTNEYIYILADNMVGSVAKYDYEYFSDPSNCVFECKGAINSGCSIKMYPKNYKNVSANKSEGLTGAKIPVCSWTSDIYTNWLTSHAIDIPLKLANNILSIGTGMAKMGAGDIKGAGETIGGLNGIMGQVSEIYQHSLAPYQAQGNTNVGDVMYAMGDITPTFYQMTIKKEYAEIIDKYFDMFGYKINLVKVPNITGRTNWNYVKTIDCNFEGDIPQTDLQIIKRIFNNGITLWHNPSTMLNYSNSNTIVS